MRVLSLIFAMKQYLNVYVHTFELCIWYGIYIIWYETISYDTVHLIRLSLGAWTKARSI